MKRLIENMNDLCENHIFPFFWQHGEEEETLREYMGKIYESGIQAVCLEARPHPEFLKEKWWRDFDIIPEEAKKRNMKIWILDDSHFPTGYADGKIKENFPQYRKRYLKLHQLDFAGPCKDAQALIAYAFSDQEDRLEGVYLAKKTDYQAIDPETIRDITEEVQDCKIVSFSIPEGEWKILVLVSTFKGGEKQTEDYLNPIVPEATDVLLNTVYEPHFTHYKEEFGKTILGFFSDEPRFGNMHGSEGSIGRYEMVLPWRDDMAELLAGYIGETKISKIKQMLPLLWLEGGEKAYQIRYQYMDLVSELYAENFSGRIGKWCNTHGVEYIGHTIEDNNSTARLGYGAGHFFKAMRGQDMAGIDVVLHQLMPGMDHGLNKAMTSKGWDGEFFHYVLGKLGSSLGHIDPKKKGRVMSEVFGAYGWAEGNRLMKWITDYMLVRGVNEFCPHAFDPKEYPDVDCPPHFYAHGMNPQFQDFGILMKYMNRMANLLSGGIHRAPVAILYHGEAEWSGEYILMQKPCAALTRNQIDFDILPAETVVKSQIVDRKFQVNKEQFSALVIPYAEALPATFLKKIPELAKNGIKIYQIDLFPSRSSEGIDVSEILSEIENLSRMGFITVVTLEELVPALMRDNIYEIKAVSEEPYLRYYHYEQEDGHILMLTNEAPDGIIETELEVPFYENVYKYDAFSNQVEKLHSYNWNQGRLKIHLSAYESIVYCWCNEKMGESWNRISSSIKETVERDGNMAKITYLTGPFKVSFASQENYPNFTDEILLEQLKPIQKVKGKEEFSGVIRYEMTFWSDKKIPTYLTLNRVYEGARVSLNGSDNMIRICPPYRFDLSEYVQKGENQLVIEVTTTLARKNQDWLSQFILMEPIGITESIMLEQYRD